MSLRDWFAGQIIAGFSCASPSEDCWSLDGAAETAYLLADAMLKAREQKKPEST